MLASPLKNLLDVEDLRITFNGYQGRTEAVKGISFGLEEGCTLALVGESGSGKSVTALALTQLLPTAPTCTVSGTARYQGHNLLKLSGKALRRVRGKEIAYIFQEPSTALNPVFTVGYQIAEAVRQHLPELTDVDAKVIESLRQVRIRDPELRCKDYPHQLSGGMQQRVMIAMALACQPRILIADEPTTSLDGTIQKQIIELLAQLRRQLRMAVILITHNFSIVKEFADTVIVMFRGEIVERGPTVQVLENPQHLYTRALIDCIPKLGQKRRRLPSIDYEQL